MWRGEQGSCVLTCSAESNALEAYLVGDEQGQLGTGDSRARSSNVTSGHSFICKEM
jgi:hypothetical protein